ncbi:MAG: hypothetical protein EHM20_00010 [Alphaproteobacteria bacterium]|nr:MAG: hypothetical protein EHM20_17840 [Alphaproteobacteria bacterium]RPJ79807.1 MAG: hypothetical protein EHM20_00010 [Alphaproteobacteria bacterium]
MIEDYYIPCVRKRPGASTKNSKFEYQTTYTNTPINGYIGNRNGLEQVISEKTEVKSQYNFYCDDFALQYGDLIYYNLKTYKVISDPQNTINANHHIKAIVEWISNIS